jgi:hypothetical protein
MMDGWPIGQAIVGVAALLAIAAVVVLLARCGGLP